MNMETLRDRFDKITKGRLPSDMTLVTISRPEWENYTELCKDFFSAELLLLAEGLEGQKVTPNAREYIDEVKKGKDAPFDWGFDYGCRKALDLAISHLKEAAK